MIKSALNSIAPDRFLSAIALSLVGLGALAGAADANVYCVDRSDAVCTSTEASPQAALTAASLNTGPDRVLLGTDTYTTTTGLVYSNGTPTGTVEIEGAGVGQTIITIDDLTGSKSIFSVTANGDSSIRDLSILGIANPDGSGDTGLRLAGDGVEAGPTASNIRVESPAATNLRGVRLQASTLAGSEVELPLGDSNTAVHKSDQDAAITRSDLTASYGVVHSGAGTTTTVTNSTIKARTHGVGIDSGNVEVLDTLIVLDGTSGGSGIYLANDNAGNSPINGTVSGSTIVGGHPSNSDGIVVMADNNLEETSLNLDNTVISGPSRPLHLIAGNGRTVSATVSHSSYETSNVAQDAMAHGVAGTIEYEVGDGFFDLTTDPGFIDAAGGDFHLAASSPLLDIGDPAEPVAGATDFEGDPRACNATSTGIIRRDIGADERRSPAADDCAYPETSIVGGPGPVTTYPFGFSVASDDGLASWLCSFDGGSEFACGPLVAAPDLGLGPHVFSVRAVDQYGNIDPTPATRDYTVIDGEEPACESEPSLCPPIGDTTPPRVLKLKAPKKTEKKRVKVTFRSNEAKVVFTCRLNRSKPMRCKSPWKTPKLKKGKNVIQVWATDQAGNRSGVKTVKVSRKR